MAALEEDAAATNQFPRATTQVVASAFRDSNLYAVVDDASGEFPAAGPVRVLRGTFKFPDSAGNAVLTAQGLGINVAGSTAKLWAAMLQSVTPLSTRVAIDDRIGAPE